MNNSMVAHLWANEKKESARGSNFFFEGRSIYSYGYHFEVGRIVRNKCGKKAYLLNDKYYSSSTCKHQHCVRSAIPTGSKVLMLMRSRRIQWNGCRVHDAASGLWSGSSITGEPRRADAGQTVIVIGACERKVLCRS